MNLRVNTIKNKEYSFFPSTLLLTLLLVLLDIYMRGFSLNIYFVVAVLYLFCSLYILQCVLSLFKTSFFIVTLFLLISLIYAGILLFQYNIYNLYQSFATDEIFKTAILDFQYWLNNFIELIDIKIVFYYFSLVLVLFIFFLYSRLKLPFLNQYVFLKYKCTIFYGSLIFVIFTNPQIYYQTAEVSYIKNFSAFILNSDIMVEKEHKRIFDSIEAKPVKFNILLLVNESLRSDHLNHYGYGRNTSPNISKYFNDAFLFENCFSATAVTHWGLLSTFTGLFPSVSALSAPTLWQYASQLDLETFYFGSQMLSWSGGLDKFFLEDDYIDTVFSPIASNKAAGHDDSITIKAFEEYLEQTNNQNFFGVIHFNATHFPYLEHKETDTFFPVTYIADPNKKQEMINAYDNSIISLDKSIGVVMELLKENNVIDNTVVILLSDHAEAFGEHGKFFHTVIMHNEAIKVPLLLLIPEQIKKTIGDKKLQSLRVNEKKYTSNLDIMPTILSLYGILTEHKLDGISLFKESNNTYVFSTIDERDQIFSYINRGKGKKYLFDNKKSELYITNLEKDPLEKKSQTVVLDKIYNRDSAMKYIQKIESIK